MSDITRIIINLLEEGDLPSLNDDNPHHFSEIARRHGALFLMYKQGIAHIGYLVPHAPFRRDVPRAYVEMEKLGGALERASDPGEIDDITAYIPITKEDGETVEAKISSHYLPLLSRRGNIKSLDELNAHLREWLVSKGYEVGEDAHDTFATLIRSHKLSNEDIMKYATTKWRGGDYNPPEIEGDMPDPGEGIACISVSVADFRQIPVIAQALNILGDLYAQNSFLPKSIQTHPLEFPKNPEIVEALEGIQMKSHSTLESST